MDCDPPCASDSGSPAHFTRVKCLLRETVHNTSDHGMNGSRSRYARLLARGCLILHKSVCKKTDGTRRGVRSNGASFKA